MTKFDADFIVVGSGPAGVSACYPLLEAGLNVLMLDSGSGFNLTYSSTPFSERRLNEINQNEWMIGKNFYSLFNSEAVSPKMRVPAYENVFANSKGQDFFETQNFYAAKSSILGGLSNAWGCGVAILSNEEFINYPFQYSEIIESYQRVSKRIGISGGTLDDLSDYYLLDQLSQPPIDLGVMQKNILNSYSKNKSVINKFGLKIGRSRVAAISETASESRSACNSCGNCLWGCSRGSLYNATFEMSYLKKFSNFRIREKHEVNLLRSNNEYAEVSGTSPSGLFSLKAKRVILAAGTLSSTQIILTSLKNKFNKIPLNTSPSAAFLLWLPRYFGRSRADEFGLGQLSFTQKLLTNCEKGFGSLFSVSSIPVSEFTRAMPFSSRNALSFLGPFLSSCIAGNIFFSSIYSKNWIERQSNDKLKIVGQHSEKLEIEGNLAKKTLRNSFLKMGAILLPGSFRLGMPGADIHYASTIPMSKSPLGLQTDKFGCIEDLNRVNIVDGSVLPVLSEKSHTLTIMANADRIATHLSRKFNS